MLFNNILETVGNTPLVKVRSESAEVYLKLEWFGMGGSTKDRAALKMIKTAEESGKLKKGMTIIESSSGNTAIGLAIIASQKGYRFMALCDQNLPLGKKNRLIALGADIIFLPPTPEGVDTVELRIEAANKLVKKIPNSITLNQFSNAANVAAHYEQTGPEIWSDTNGEVDVCVVFCGTCGSVSGIGRYLKEKNKNVKVIAVEPDGSTIFGGIPKPYYISGGGLSFTPTILDKNAIDYSIKVTDEEAYSAAINLASQEGILVGSTGGAVVHVAHQISKLMKKNQKVVAVMPDIGDRYIDSLYDPNWVKERIVVKKIKKEKIASSILKTIQEEGYFLDE